MHTSGTTHQPQPRGREREQTDRLLPEQWRDRLACLFISLKNPGFTRNLITWYVELCEEYFEQGIICIVDEPYQYNLMAEVGSDALTTEQINGLRLSAFTKRMQAQRCINAVHSLNVQLVPWFYLARQTPAWLRDELETAFARRGDLYHLIIQQVQASRQLADDTVTLERYAKFVLCETPVLTAAYYTVPAGVVDFYPGANAAFYEHVEAGKLVHELPRTTIFVQASQPLVYVEVRER